MSAPHFVSIREFAKLDGCNDKLVRRAINSGKLSTNEDGKLDASLAGSGWRRENRRADTGADIANVSAPAVRTVRTPRGTPIKAPAPGDLAAAIDGISDKEADDFLVDVLAGKFRLTGEAEQIKENALAAKHLIAARKDAGDLVEVARAETLFFNAARSWRDIWMGFPTRVGPLLAADLGIETDKVVEALTIHVQEQLEQLGQPSADFTAQEQ